MNFETFKKIVQDDIKSNEAELRQFLFSELSNLPIPTVQVSSNTYIERAVDFRKSNDDFRVDRLSYIPYDCKYLAQKGRFNNAGEPHFYGTFTDIDMPENTRYYLATEIDQTILGTQSKTFNYTVGKWKSHNGFPAILFLFKSNFCANSLIEKTYNQYINSSEYMELSKEQKEFLEIITIELAKLKSANSYEITNIIFDFYKRKGFQAIIY